MSVPAPNTASCLSDPLVAELQTTLDGEIPICAEMGMRVVSLDERGLTIGLPLEKNRNHQNTAFAGSLNALCTIAGWGSVFLLVRRTGHRGHIVIRRSTIRYLQPVERGQIQAVCPPVPAEQETYFFEMLREKGQAKLDLSVSVAGEAGPAVSFSGSYVVLAEKASVD